MDGQGGSLSGCDHEAGTLITGTSHAKVWRWNFQAQGTVTAKPWGGQVLTGQVFRCTEVWFAWNAVNEEYRE